MSNWQTSDAGFARAEFPSVADLLPRRTDNVEGNERNEEAARLIPRRLYRGPLWAGAHTSRLDEMGRDEWWELGRRIEEEASRTVPVLAQYWSDGQRTVEEISQQIALETGLEATPQLVEYFQFVERLGLIELTTRE